MKKIKEFKCKKCGSVDITMTIALNPNSIETVNKFFSVSPVTSEGWCNKCKGKCSVEIIEMSSSYLHCVKYGSNNLNKIAEVKPNECNEVLENSCSKTDWCESCQSQVNPDLKNELEKMLNNWMCTTDFITMEKITGLKQYNYDAKEGYQAFIDACKTMWKDLSIEEEKTSLWNQYKH